MFDPGSFVVAGISLAAFTFGAVQALKDWFGWEGKKVTALSMGMGVIVMAVYQAIQYAPAEYVSYIEAIFISLAFGLSASGYYKFATRKEE